MNPLAPAFRPRSYKGHGQHHSFSVRAANNADLLFDQQVQLHEQHVENYEAMLRRTGWLMTIPPHDDNNDQYNHKLDVYSGYNWSAIPSEDRIETMISQSPNSLMMMILAGYEWNATGSSYSPARTARYQPISGNYTGIEYFNDPPYDRQQPTISSDYYLTPAPFIESRPQSQNYYKTHLYSRPSPLRTPLPPSYSYPWLTPPDLPYKSNRHNCRRRQPYSYDNTPLALHYLTLFTDIYGTSPTSLPSLHAICITLSHHRDSLPQKVRAAQNYIKNCYVNIFDLVAAGSRGECVSEELVFQNAAELRRYSERQRKICPAAVGRGWKDDENTGNELWRWMLRKWY